MVSKAACPLREGSDSWSVLGVKRFHILTPQFSCSLEACIWSTYSRREKFIIRRGNEMENQHPRGRRVQPRWRELY